MISTLALILVLVAAGAGIVWYIHREAHHDCSCGCAGCALAKNCKRATLVLVAMLVAMGSNGFNIEHHCDHCHAHHCAHAHCDHHEDCDHCPDCYFIHFDFDQYDLTVLPEFPQPEFIGEMVHQTIFSYSHIFIFSFADYCITSPPHEGRDILLTTSKLSI